MEMASLFCIASLRRIRAAALAVVDGSPLKWDEGEYDPHGEAVKNAKR